MSRWRFPLVNKPNKEEEEEEDDEDALAFDVLLTSVPRPAPSSPVSYYHYSNETAIMFLIKPSQRCVISHLYILLARAYERRGEDDVTK